MANDTDISLKVNGGLARAALQTRLTIRWQGVGATSMTCTHVTVEVQNEQHKNGK